MKSTIDYTGIVCDGSIVFETVNRKITSPRYARFCQLSFRWMVMLLSTLAIAILANGCQPSTTESVEAEGIPVEVLEVNEEHLEESTILVGVLDAFHSVDIVPEVSGKIESIYHDVCASVSSGTILATLDNTVYR